MQTRQNDVYALLRELNIEYTKVSHAPAFTMEDVHDPECELGARFCKNLFLSNRQQTEFFLLLLSGDKRFRSANVSKKLNRSRLSFGGEEELFRLLGVSPGAVSPLGLMFDKKCEIRIVIDRDLLKSARVCVHPCVNTESVAVKTSDLIDVFIPHCGHVPEFVDLD